METIKDLKYNIELIDYLCSDEHILTNQTNNYISRSQTEQEDTREPDSFYPLCFY